MNCADRDFHDACSRTSYPLFYPSSLINLLNSYSDATFLSILYYELQGQIDISKRVLEEYCYRERRDPCYNSCRELVPYRNPCREVERGCSERGSSERAIAANVIAVQTPLAASVTTLLTTLLLTLDVNQRNFVMSDNTLIRMQRPKELYERNYLVILTSMEEETLALCTYAAQTSATASVVTQAKTVIAALSAQVSNYINILNGY